MVERKEQTRLLVRPKPHHTLHSGIFYHAEGDLASSQCLACVSLKENTQVVRDRAGTVCRYTKRLSNRALIAIRADQVVCLDSAFASRETITQHDAHSTAVLL